MYYLNITTADPFLNLAIEEILLKNDSRDFFLLYINNPSVVIGKHQTAHREADTKFTFENNIPVIRRISGGGTVYHDQGNLNFSFITRSESGKQVDFRRYTAPVINFLRSMNIDARFEGKNDIRVDGLKISGNAEHVHRERVLHHGTLLFDASLNELGNSIRKDTSCYSSRSVNSNPSEVTNLSRMLPAILQPCFSGDKGFIGLPAGHRPRTRSGTAYGGSRFLAHQHGKSMGTSGVASI